MSRLTSESDETYVMSSGMRQIPIKWTAPEAMRDGVYTTKCDVWCVVCSFFLFL